MARSPARYRSQPRAAPPVLRNTTMIFDVYRWLNKHAVEDQSHINTVDDLTRRNSIHSKSPTRTMDQSSKPTFSFVNLKHPDDLKDEETQLRIRRLAMTEVGKARRKPKTKRGRNEIVLELRNSTQRQPDIDRLGGGRIDPFSRYPIELDDDARALLANSKTSGSSSLPFH